jgi:hypothetical protein
MLSDNSDRDHVYLFELEKSGYHKCSLVYFMSWPTPCIVS